MKQLLLPVAAFALATAAQAQVSLSEIRIDQTGADNDEYFELVGAPGTSLAGMWYIVIGDGSSTTLSGVVETVVDLSAYSINANGFFVAAEATFTLGVADVLLPGANDLNFENSDNVTHLLVTGFTGADGDDLDTNDDGILDTTPWASIVDSVAFIETPGTGDMVYSTNQVGPDGAFVPGLVFTCSGVWTIGQFDPSLGEDTPGAANLCGTTNMSTFCDPANNNSTGAPVVLSGSMGSGVGSGLHLEATGGPTSEFGYVLVGTAPETVAPLAISDGLLCLSTAAPNQLGRYNIVGTDMSSVGSFDASGVLQNLVGTSAVGSGYDVASTLPLTGTPTIMAGETWHFQLWYRDGAAGTGHSNFSNGLSVTF
ncbi:MAG: hypothetical protein R3F33_15120 [Planctomycetota bacterium]